MEIVEPRGNVQGANAEHCLLLARDAFGVTDDLRPALTALVERQLVVAASNDHAMVVVPFWGGVESALVLAGRAAAELGRAPIPSAATRLFESALRPWLGEFRHAGYGIGTPTIAELSAMAERLQQRQLDGSFLIGPRGPNLLVRARHGRLPFYASFAFDEAATRDEALRQLSGYSEPIFGLPLRCTTVLQHPLAVIPSRRFVLAVGRVLGRDLMPFSVATGRDALLTPIGFEEEAIWRVDFVAAVRALCSDEECLAYGLEESLGLLFHEDGDSTVLVEVSGGEGARRMGSRPELASPFARFQVGVDAGLVGSERVGKITWRGGLRSTQGPVIEELATLVQRARAFNQSQERLRLALTEASLGPTLTAAAEGQLADAQALRGVVSHGGEVPALSGVSTCVLLKLDEPQPHLLAGAEAATMTASAPNDLGRDEVLVRTVEVFPTWGDRDERIAYFEPLFGVGVDVSQSTGWRHSTARSELARLLGHESSEVVFSSGDDDPVG